MADDDDDDDDDGKAPAVYSMPATDVGAGGALLQAYLKTNGRTTNHRFEYGPTSAYGQSTPVRTAGSNDSGWRLVSVRVDDLSAATTYHFRLVATNSRGTTRGKDRAFITLSPEAPTNPQPSERPADPEGSPVTSKPADSPQYGSTVGVSPGRGNVLVRLPGSGSFAPLAAGSVVPLGTVIDTRRGTVGLEAALPSGKTQAGRFGGGKFLVRQSRRGMVDLYLRGRYCSSSDRQARRAGTASVASAARRSSRRRLWGRDRGGRFRTHGRNSHATVRGTRWLVEDRCEGTLTRVTEGAVVVRDLRLDRRRLVRAGERYLARPRP